MKKIIATTIAALAVSASAASASIDSNSTISELLWAKDVATQARESRPAGTPQWGTPAWNTFSQQREWLKTYLDIPESMNLIAILAAVEPLLVAQQAALVDYELMIAGDITFAEFETRHPSLSDDQIGALDAEAY